MDYMYVISSKVMMIRRIWGLENLLGEMWWQEVRLALTLGGSLLWSDGASLLQNYFLMHLLEEGDVEAEHLRNT